MLQDMCCCQAKSRCRELPWLPWPLNNAYLRGMQPGIASSRQGGPTGMGHRRPMRMAALRLRLCVALLAGVPVARPSRLLWEESSTVRSFGAESAAAASLELVLAPGSAIHDLAWSVSRDDHVFVHIPKTGGSSVEAQIAKQGRAAPLHAWARFLGGDHSHKCVTSGSLSAWHLTVAQARRCHLRPDLYTGKTTFCVLRDPVDRVVSELEWRRKMSAGHEHDFFDYTHFGRAMHNSTPEQEILTFANAVAFFVRELPRRAYGTPESPFTESGIHLQPQAWYVFDEEGRQTCDKVGLTEDVHFGAWENAAASSVASRGGGAAPAAAAEVSSREEKEQRRLVALLSTALRERLREILWEAYRDDFRLVEQLRAALRHPKQQQQPKTPHTQRSLHTQL